MDDFQRRTKITPSETGNETVGSGKGKKKLATYKGGIAQGRRDKDGWHTRKRTRSKHQVNPK